MEVRINNTKIDARIENETNALEVIRQLDRWLSREGFFISSVLVNGRASSPSDETVLKQIPVDEIELLDINAMPLDELSYERFATLLQFFSYFHQALKKNNQQLITDLRGELPHILRSMDDILRLKVGKKLVSEVFAGLLEETAPREIELTPELDLFLQNLCIYIEGRIREIANPLLELKSTAELLESQIPQLEEIPILLQTGKEREAMQKVITFTEINEKLTRLFPLLTEKDEGNLMSRSIDGTPFADFYTDLNAKLQELTEAMEAEDSILIGDLLEYEIAPKIRILTTSIGELPVFAGTRQ